jgi:hypothetical protein
MQGLDRIVVLHSEEKDAAQYTLDPRVYGERRKVRGFEGLDGAGVTRVRAGSD